LVGNPDGRSKILEDPTGFYSYWEYQQPSSPLLSLLSLLSLLPPPPLPPPYSSSSSSLNLLGNPDKRSVFDDFGGSNTGHTGFYSYWEYQQSNTQADSDFYIGDPYITRLTAELWDRRIQGIFFLCHGGSLRDYYFFIGSSGWNFFRQRISLGFFFIRARN
jgi:hypothetical protein